MNSDLFDILFAVIQGRQSNGQRTQAEQQILAELLGLHLFFKITVGGHDQSEVAFDLGFSAQGPEAAQSTTTISLSARRLL